MSFTNIIPHILKNAGITQSPQYTPSRNLGIDLLRGVSILFIVGFWHLLNYTTAFPGYANPLTVRLKIIILATFVFISGYFIGLKKLSLNNTDILNFYKKRLLRIYPLYLFALAIFSLYDTTTATGTIKAALSLSMLIKPAPPTLWFVTMLILFYIAAPFMAHASRTLSTTSLLCCYTLVLAALVTYALITSKLDTRLIRYFPPFAMGIFVATTEQQPLSRPFHLAIVIIAALLTSFIAPSASLLHRIMSIPMALVVPYALFLFARQLTIPCSLHTPTILLSYISYAMYLFHRPIYSALTHLYFPQSHPAQLAYLLLCALPCLMLTALIIQTTFDRVIRHLTQCRLPR